MEVNILKILLELKIKEYKMYLCYRFSRGILVGLLYVLIGVVW